MICSGKSTYCKNAAQHGQLILNDDAIVNLVHADQYHLYEEELKIVYKSLENHLVSSVLTVGRSIVVDRGVNVSKSARTRWIALARCFDVPCEAVVFHKESPEIHAERRVRHDDRGYDYAYWLKVAQRHDSIYAEPTLEEGFSNVHNIEFSDITNGKVIK